jgi:hypothetical protein
MLGTPPAVSSPAPGDSDDTPSTPAPNSGFGGFGTVTGGVGASSTTPAASGGFGGFILPVVVLALLPPLPRVRTPLEVSVLPPTRVPPFLKVLADLVLARPLLAPRCLPAMVVHYVAVTLL